MLIYPTKFRLFNHAHSVADTQISLGCEVKLVELPDLEEKEDVSDWIAKGHSKMELLQIIKDTPEYDPSKHIKLKSKQKAQKRRPISEILKRPLGKH